MAASSGHLSPAEAAPSPPHGSQRPTSAHSDISHKSTVPTVASSLGNFPHAGGSDSLQPTRTPSGRSTPAGYHLRGSRPPSVRDPNAHLDDLCQIPERPAAAPPAPPVVSPSSDHEDAAVKQAIKKGSKIFRKRRHKRSDGESDENEEEEPASRKHHIWRKNEFFERQKQEAQKQLAERADQVIDVYDGDEQITSAGEVPEVERPQKPVYVWEVMYENQRGMSLFGKKWYSANSLLPSDPTAYTLPTELPGVTTIAASERNRRSRAARLRGHTRGRSASTSALPDSQDTSSSSADTKTSQPKAFKRKTIDTGYDLKTYQTPSPEWIWLTPWMVNMRLDADEQGFRYNLWFHRRGWRSHAGRLNWWGWVRRREWMRLRVLLPSTALEREVGGIEDNAKEWPATLDEVMARPQPVHAMVKLLVVELLDRERLECFFQWWDNGSEEARLALKGELEDYDNLDLLSKAFVFAHSRRVFLMHLVTQKIITKGQADAILSRLFEPMSPSASAASSPAGRPRSLRSAPSDSSSDSPVAPKSPQPAQAPPPPSNVNTRPQYHRSPSSSFSSPPTPLTPTFRPEHRHYPFNYTPARNKPDEDEDREPSLKEASEGDVD